jgi:hypothetical protein
MSRLGLKIILITAPVAGFNGLSWRGSWHAICGVSAPIALYFEQVHMRFWSRL